MAAKQPAKPSKVMDVSKPGKTAPPGNSRGVIIPPRRSVIADPMVTDQSGGADDQADAAAETQAPSSSHTLGSSGRVIQPLTAPPLAGKSKTTKKSEEAATITVAVGKKDEVPSPDDAPEEVVASSSPKEHQPTIAELAEAGDPPETIDTESETPVAPPTTLPAETPKPAAVEPVPEASNVDAPPKDAQDKQTVADPVEQEVAEQAEREANVEKLVEGKQFFLPIKTVEQRRTKRTVILGIAASVLLGVAWLNVALDAGIVNLGVNLPHTHYFDSQDDTNSNAAAPAAATVDTASTMKLAALGVQFQYPSKWEVIGGDDKVVDPKATNESLSTVLIQPKGTPANAINDSDALAKGAINIYLQNDDPATSGATAVTYTVKSIQYKKLGQNFGGAVYLRDVIYQSNTGVISLVSNLTNENTQKVGVTAQTNVQAFSPTAGKNLIFQILALKSNENGMGFKSVDEAQAFLKSANYQQARNILLSTAKAQ